MFARASPARLQHICMDFITDHLRELCEEVTVDNNGVHAQMRFKCQDFSLHPDLADGLLKSVVEKKLLDDCCFSLFSDPKKTSLRRAYLKNALITPLGLCYLKKHKLIDLDISGIMRTISGNNILESLGEWTLKNLQVLNCCGVNPFVNFREAEHISQLWSNLQSLLHLNISKTEVDSNVLEVLVSKLPMLESLDISLTHVDSIRMLEYCKGRLKSLTMADVKFSSDMFDHLTGMMQLRHLDISRRANNDTALTVGDPFLQKNINSFLNMPSCLPNITSLDLSGWDCVEEEVLRTFLQNHPDLNFIGLMLTNLCQADYLADEECSEFRSDLKITGDATQPQLCEALIRYNGRANYSHKALFSLFNFTQGIDEVHPSVLKAIFGALRNFPSHLGIQMAGSATMFNMARGTLANQLHVSILAELVHLTLAAMRTFPYSQQLQKNCLLILYNDTVLRDVKFDRFLTAQLSLQCLHTFDDSPMRTMAVFILSEAALKINSEDIETLASQSNIRKLLQIVKEKIEAKQVDYALKFTLSALWNLTDECPSSCSIFLEEQGLEIFLQMLEAFPDEDNLQTKVLGLMNNVAEVKELRTARLVKEEFIHHLCRLLKSNKIEVGYFAAGVVAHIVSDGTVAWPLQLDLRRDLVCQLYDTVNNWQLPDSTVVAYRSFRPFFPLLGCTDTPAAQLWAVWAMLYVCTIHDRYCPLLLSDGGLPLLKALLSDPSTDIKVRETAAQVLELLENCEPSQQAA
ncbi:protein zyg-11 homolog B-like [Ptychodera flava]|uniref:protein zyg-11 homolog B-like n=1 Tax=Ptychodera flava TaxID=63121 RepID=UPI003969F9A3